MAWTNDGNGAGRSHKRLFNFCSMRWAKARHLPASLIDAAREGTKIARKKAA